MILLMIIGGWLLVAFCVCYAGAWLYYRMVPGKNSRNNPYIEEHLSILQNDLDYEAYLEYLDKNNLDGVALDKKMSKGEFDMKKELGLLS